MMLEFFKGYSERLQEVLRTADWRAVGVLAEELLGCLRTGRQGFICGNGGSAANAMHIANDFLSSGLRVHALPANASVITCLANDEGYDKIFSLQLATMARPEDVLIVLSGSGNSPNIIEAIQKAKELGVRTYGILGYSGGLAKTLVQVPIHFPVNDMQISEDLQLVTGHMIAQWLYAHK